MKNKHVRIRIFSAQTNAMDVDFFIEMMDWLDTVPYSVKRRAPCAQSSILTFKGCEASTNALIFRMKFGL